MRIWLDDIRPLPKGFDFSAETESECIVLLSGGDCSHISFDHDLGPEYAGTGYGVARWIEERAAEGVRVVDSWDIHSANPVGRKRISAAMESAERLLAVRRPGEPKEAA